MLIDRWWESTHDGQRAAASSLADGGADVGEFVNAAGALRGCWFVSLRLTAIGEAQHVRGAQSKSARPRTSVAQQTGVPEMPEQRRAAWRASRAGMAEATAAVAPVRAMKMVEKCMLFVVDA